MSLNGNSMELIRMPQVIKMTGMSKSAIYAQIKEGAFPRPLKISQRHVAWDKQHVIDWIQSLPLAKGPTWVDNTTQI